MVGKAHRVLVLGGGGFVGQSVVSCLERNGYEVGVYSLGPKPQKWSGVYFDRDLLRDDSFDDVLRGYDSVVYLISTTTPQSSMSNPCRVYQNDLPMLLKILDACVEIGVSRVVFASSGGTVYGRSSVPNKEDAQVFPICHYAIGKLAAEKLLCMYNDLHGMENIALRISNPFGFGQSPDSGVGAITVFANCVARGEAISLFGSKDTVRDFVGIEYVAQAFLCALEWEFDDSISPVFNIGSGQGLSIGEIIDIIFDAVGTEVGVEHLPARKQDVPCSILDISKAKDYLAYTPPLDLKQDIFSYAQRVKERVG